MRKAIIAIATILLFTIAFFTVVWIFQPKKPAKEPYIYVPDNPDKAFKDTTK